jgi:prophage antirepressor-like protein
MMKLLSFHENIMKIELKTDVVIKRHLFILSKHMGRSGTYMDLIKFEGHEVRVLNQDGTDWDGQQEAWFIPRQVATAIGAANPKVYASNILNRNPEKFEGFKGVCKLSTPHGGTQEINIINENGLYMFLMASDLPKAVQFQRRVTELLKGIRQGKVKIMQSENKEEKLIRAKAMELNARTRQAKLMTQIASQFKGTLSDESIQLLLSGATEVLVGTPILPKPDVPVLFTATEIAEEMDVSANKIGRLANKHNLKTSEYGKWILDKAKSHDKQVRSFLYNEKGRARLIDLLNEDK